MHRIQLQQLVPGLADAAADGEVDIAGLADRLAPELVQLWYQMAIAGRRDLPLAPNPRTGFEMSLLRMLAFRPEAQPSRGGAAGGRSDAAARAPRAATSTAGSNTAPAAPLAAKAAGEGARAPTAVAPDVPTVASAPARARSHAPAATARSLRDSEDWIDTVAGAGLKGPVRDLAGQCTFVSDADGVLTLALPADLVHLRDERLLGRLAEALGPALGRVPKITLASVAEAGDTLHARDARARDERQAKAERDFRDNADVRRYMQQFGAKLVPDSIRPVDD